MMSSLMIWAVAGTVAASEGSESAMRATMLEVYAGRVVGWNPYVYNELTWPTQGTLDRYGHGGGGLRTVFGAGPGRFQWTAGLDTQHWGTTWAREPSSVRARVHHYSLEGGIMRRFVVSERFALQASGGLGPMHQHLARPERRTLPAWGLAGALGVGMTTLLPSDWGVSADWRSVSWLANRSTSGEVLSLGGDYEWEWNPGGGHWEARLSVAVPIHRWLD